ncbi:D(2) dopamine receptor B-like [Patiria miniata]|uniref:G-protein coupled receptors family 1 profile domain-containing protein n=1 Tax=Patiria miniata TaxID=46514 RepID=A0A914AXR7_PATMI|nr:D(2) dopamine receptor B-like [Patiria miniata]
MANCSDPNASIVPDNSCDTGIFEFALFFIAAVFVFGVPGNCLILRVYWTKARKTSTHVLIMALAWADLSVCLLQSVYIAELALECGGNGTHLIFLLIGTFETIGIAISLGITAVIAVDRYDCICRPQRRFCTPRRAKVAVFVVVLISVIGNIPEGINDFLLCPYRLLGIGLLVPIFQTIAVLIALIAIVLCYGKVYARILKHVRVGAIPERTLTQDDRAASKIDKDRTIPSTQCALPRKDQLSAIHSKCSTQLIPEALARLEANTSVVDNEVSTVINLASTSYTTHHASTSRLDILEVPQNTNDKMVNLAERDSKVGQKSVSQLSEQGCSNGGDMNHHEATPDTVRRHAPKRMGGAVLQRKTTKMLFVTSVVLLLTWLPVLIYNAIEIAYLTDSNIDTKSAFLTQAILDWLFCIIYANSAINPLIYGLANKRFRKDCTEVFRKIRR